MDSKTVPAPEPEKSGSFVPGTIGFDLYVAALRVPRSALKPAPVPFGFCS